MTRRTVFIIGANGRAQELYPCFPATNNLPSKA